MIWNVVGLRFAQKAICVGICPQDRVAMSTLSTNDGRFCPCEIDESMYFTAFDESGLNAYICRRDLGDACHQIHMY